MGEPAAKPLQIMVPPPPIGAAPPAHGLSPVPLGKRHSSASPSSSGSVVKRPHLLLDTELALLECGSELALVPPRTPAACKAGRRTALHDAIVAVDEGAVSAALDGLQSAALLNCQDELGFTPLITAAGLEAGAGVSERLVRLLLSRGADPSASDTCGYTGAREEEPRARRRAPPRARLPASRAARAPRAYPLRAHLLTPIPPAALHWAAALGNVPVCALLTAAGAPLDARAADGETPLHRACRLGHAPCAKALLGARADPAARTARGEGAIELAGCYGGRSNAKLRLGVTRALFAAAPQLRTLLLSHPDCLLHATHDGHQEVTGRDPARARRCRSCARAQSARARPRPPARPGR